MNLSYLMYAGLLPVAICIAISQPLMAQAIDEADFTLYTKQQGLSANNVTGIAQDAAGYIWIATSSGLNRFDGSSFQQFRTTTDSLSIPAEDLSSLAWLDSSHLAASSRGLYIVDTHTGQTRNLFVPYRDKKYLYKFNAKMAACSNTTGDIFVLTHAGFYHFDKNYRLLFRFDYYTEEEVATTSFGFSRYLMQLDQQHLLVTGIDANYYYDAANRRFKKLAPADCPLLGDLTGPAAAGYVYFQLKPGRFIFMNGDSDSLVYIDIPNKKRTVSRLPFPIAKTVFDYRSALSVISDTLLYITGNTNGFYKMSVYPESGATRFYPEQYFSHYYCRYLLKDHDNNLWIATNKGLFRQDNNRPYIRQAPIPSMVEARFPGIYIDDISICNDKIYVATRKNGGLLEFDKKRFRFTRHVDFSGYRKSSNNIFALATTCSNSLLVGTIGPLYSLNPETGIKKEMALEGWDRQRDWIADLYKDRKGNVWVATSDVYKWDAVTRRCHLIPRGRGFFEKIQRPNSIREDASGNIWFAGHGLLRYNTTTNTFDRYFDSFPFIRIPDRQVTAFVADEQKNLWLCSNNNGLTCYNTDKGVTHHFTREDGLPDNNIADMVIIGDKLWIASYSGIACLNLQNFSITAFGTEDGFPDQPIVNGARFAWDRADNKLYIGFTNIIVCFDPGIIYRKSPAPRLFIENIITGDQQKIPFPGQHITLPWKNNGITVTIGSINFFTSNSQRFAYRLIKEDSGHWQQLGTQNTFSISNLPSGTHHIQVKMFSLNNRWREQVKETSITILPPFWKQTWFPGVCTVLLLAAAYVLLKWRTGLIRKKEQAKTHIQELKAEEYKSQFELEQIRHQFSSSLALKQQEIATINQQLAEAQLSALQTQMNPHFIFNSLNSIKGMILDNEQQKASRYLSKFAHMIRITLGQSREVFTTLCENTDHLESYLAMEKLRFDDSFTFQITVDEGIDTEETLIPSLMIQPLAENAIWHGLMPRKGEKKLSIRFTQSGDFLSCIIEDNGIGIKRSEQLKLQNRPTHQSEGLGNLRNRIKILNEKYHTGCRLDIVDLGELNRDTTGTRAILRFNTITNKPYA